ncbi:MAG: ABC transporter permease [Planctomycetes bacterium]|nr:ABC transporter permease [Planctomycetota bacterium]
MEELALKVKGYEVHSVILPEGSPLPQGAAWETLFGKLGSDDVLVISPRGFRSEEAEAISARFLPLAIPVIVLEDAGAEEVFSAPALAFIPPERVEKFIDGFQVRGRDCITRTLFFTKSVRLFWFDFGVSDRENVDIGHEIYERMWASLMITVPAFVLGLFLNIFVAMIIAYCRGSYVDKGALLICIAMMSTVTLFYVFGCQIFFGHWLRIFPISGYQPGFDALRFVALPIVISLLADAGGAVRFYRTIFLEVLSQDYMRTAWAKGLGDLSVLFRHGLKNAMLPILTGTVAAIPGLYVGSLILESFFAIPGLGSFMLDGLRAQDFRIVGSMVYLGSFMYIVGLLLTDFSYTLVDPRVRLGK